MAKVNTVLGTISERDLGVTLMHEHITYGYAGWYADDTMAPYDREGIVKDAVATLNQLKPYGVKTFVDVTTNDTGRDAGLIKEVAEKSEMNIICSTGLYTEYEGAPAYFRSRMRIGGAVVEIADLFEKEISQGISKTGVRAGVIKVATGNGNISKYEEKVLKAAARAQKATGVPIITHTENGTMGPEQADLLLAEGADPKRIMIGHICGATDIKYHVNVLAKGVYISFDRIGIIMIHSDELRKACIIGLAGIGYANRIMLSHDTIVRLLGRPRQTPVSAVPLMANWHPTHIFKNIIPALKAGGVTEEQINTMIVDNPRRLFAGE